MLPYLGKYEALLLANHGAVAWGDNLSQAFFRMEKVEHFARITLVAELLGGPGRCRAPRSPACLPRANATASGPSSRFEPGSPMAAEDMPDRNVPQAEEKILPDPRAACGHDRRSSEGPRSLLKSEKGNGFPLPFAASFRVDSGIVTSWSPSYRGVLSYLKAPDLRQRSALHLRVGLMPTRLRCAAGCIALARRSPHGLPEGRAGARRIFDGRENPVRPAHLQRHR